MAEHSAIEWTDATVNFWWGCTKVGPGCDHCYAETFDRRTGGAHWGAGVPRRKIKGALPLLRKLNADHAAWQAEHGRRRRVFIQSMADLFDNEVPAEWFAEGWRGIEAAEHLDVQIVTKRLPNVEKRLAELGVTTWPQHAGLIATAVTQDEINRDVPRLLDLKVRLGIPWVGLSIEPMLGPIDLTRWLEIRWQCSSCRRYYSGAHKPACPDCGQFGGWTGSHAFNPPGGQTGSGVDWVIVGGESGPGARPMHPQWARDIRDQCAAAGVAYFHKQNGAWVSVYDRDVEDPDWRRCDVVARETPKGRWLNLAGGHGFHGERVLRVVPVDKKAAGRLLDGAEHNGMPGITLEDC